MPPTRESGLDPAAILPHTAAAAVSPRPARQVRRRNRPFHRLPTPHRSLPARFRTLPNRNARADTRHRTAHPRDTDKPPRTCSGPSKAPSAPPPGALARQRRERPPAHLATRQERPPRRRAATNPNRTGNGEESGTAARCRPTRTDTRRRDKPRPVAKFPRFLTIADTPCTPAPYGQYSKPRIGHSRSTKGSRTLRGPFVLADVAGSRGNRFRSPGSDPTRSDAGFGRSGRIGGAVRTARRMPATFAVFGTNSA